MIPRHSSTKTALALALALALAAVAPAAAQARPIIDASPADSQRDLDALASTTSSLPHVVTVTAPRGFDWGDAGIGAGLGLALASVGTGLIIGGKRRDRPHPTIR